VNEVVNGIGMGQDLAFCVETDSSRHGTETVGVRHGTICGGGGGGGEGEGWKESKIGLKGVENYARSRN
jgi:hypothetical protein